MGLPNGCPIEYVNGGHGVKNPLAVDTQRQQPQIKEEERAPVTTKVHWNIIIFSNVQVVMGKTAYFFCLIHLCL